MSDVNMSLIDYCGLGGLELLIGDRISETRLPEMGVFVNRPKPETLSALNRGAAVAVSDVYSLPRVTKTIRDWRSRLVGPSFAFDLTIVADNG